MATVTFLTASNMAVLPTSTPGATASRGPTEVSFRYNEAQIDMIGSFVNDLTALSGTPTMVFVDGDDSSWFPELQIASTGIPLGPNIYLELYNGDLMAIVSNLLSGNDTIFGSASADTILGFTGHDLFFGGGGTDHFDGGGGIDTVSYSLAATGVFASLDVAFANAGAAAGNSFALIENLNGSAFSDVLVGNAIANQLSGLNGNDILIGRAGADLLSGGAGIDTAAYDQSGDFPGGVRADLLNPATNTGDAAGDTYISIENLAGSNGNSSIDRLYGDNNANVITGARLASAASGLDQIYGRGGNDRLFAYDAGDFLDGGTGDDVMNAGTGNDFLIGAQGRDLMTGGPNADTFIFNNSPILANRDTLIDFAPADDTIYIENAVFAKLGAPGALNAGFLRLGPAPLDANDYLVYNKATGLLTYDLNGNGIGGSYQVAIFANKPALAAGDFQVI